MISCDEQISRHFGQVRTLALSFVVLAGLLSPTLAGTPNGTAEVSYELRQLLEIPLQAKVKELMNVKNEAGIKNVRGSYFRRFVKIDDETYEVVLHKRIAGDDELRAERYLLTLKLEPGTKEKWFIADEKLERTIENLLYRGVPEDETFHEFDSFSFEREGMKLTGGKGSLYIDYWREMPVRFVVNAESLSYDYHPPQDVSYYQVARAFKDVHKKDVVFDPSRVYFRCMPEDCETILESSFTGLRDSTLEQIDDKVEKDYKEFLNDLTEARREHPMAGFNTLPRPEQRYWSAVVKRAGSDHYNGLTYNSVAPEEMTFSSSDYGPLYSYYSEDTRNGGTSLYELELRPDLEALDFDVLTVKGEVVLAAKEDAEAMECDLTYRLKINRPLDVVDFGLAQYRGGGGDRSEARQPSLKVHLMVDGEGNEISYIRRGGAFGWIFPPETLQAGEEVELHVKFNNENAIYKFNTTYSRVPRAGWLPFVRVQDTIDEIDLTISAPERYEILGVGTKISENIVDDRRVVRYTSDAGVSFPTIIFGDYISDHPKIKATKFDGTEIPVNIYVDKVSTHSFSQWHSYEEAVGELTSGINEIRPSALRPLAEQAVNALNLYREIYGIDFPYGKLDLVDDPIGGTFYGQSPATLVYLGAGVFMATGEVGHSGGTDIAMFQDSVVAHEVAHQWWGGVFANASARHYWFVESLAEYSAALYIENLYGRNNPKKGWSAYMKMVEGWRREILEADLWASVQDADTLWSGRPARGSDPRTALIYNQGPYAFHILRMTFGDEKFFAFLKNLGQTLANEDITTRDIQLVAEESFGGTMEWFFDQWIRGVGIPEYAFTYDTRMAEDKTYIVEGEIQQRILVGLDKSVIPGKAYRGAITVTVLGKDRNEYPYRVIVEGESTPFAFKVPVKPVEVTLNKNGEMLAHDVLVGRKF